MNAIKLNIWVQFYRKAKKEWFDIYLPLQAGDTEDELESFLTSNGIIYVLNDYVDYRCHGAWDFNIVSFENVDHNFNDNYDIIQKDSPQKAEKKRLKQAKKEEERKAKQAYDNMKPALVLENDYYMWESLTINKFLKHNNIKYDLFVTGSIDTADTSFDTIKEKLVTPLIKGNYDVIYIESSFAMGAYDLFSEDKEYLDQGQLLNFIRVFLKYILPNRKEPITFHIIQRVVGGVDDPMEFIDVLIDGNKSFKEELIDFFNHEKVVIIAYNYDEVKEQLKQMKKTLIIILGIVIGGIVITSSCTKKTIPSEERELHPKKRKKVNPKFAFLLDYVK